MKKIGIIILFAIGFVILFTSKKHDTKKADKTFTASELNNNEKSLIRARFALFQLQNLNKSQEEIQLAEKKVKDLEQEIRSAAIKKNPRLEKEYQLVDEIKAIRLKIRDSNSKNIQQEEIKQLQKNLQEKVTEFHKIQRENSPDYAKFLKYKDQIDSQKQKISQLIKENKTQKEIDQQRKELLMIKLDYLKQFPSHFKESTPQIIQLESEIKEDIKNNVPFSIVERKGMQLLLLKEKGI